MPAPIENPVFVFLGDKTENLITDGFTSTSGQTLDGTTNTPDKANGLEGDDLLETGLGNDLAAGDMVGDEWSYVDGRWVYDPSKVVVSTYGASLTFNDVIRTGAGNDVLLGNRGNDWLDGGAGDDVLNAGHGADDLFGGTGNDLLNLEDGNDRAEGGFGDDVINGGDGDDVIYGDNYRLNILINADASPTFQDLARQGAWMFTDDGGTDMISQSAATEAGKSYTISFELAANISGGFSGAKVEVLWNGTVVDTVETASGAFSSHEVDVISAGNAGELSFRAVQPTGGVVYDTSGLIASYDKTVNIAGAEVTVAAYAPGQSKLYQVIDGQLHVFDTAANTYNAVGAGPGFKINAIGFNVEDDLIYGVAKSNGTDALGQAVSNTDIVMIDADGAAYRIGKGFYSDYVGDFDNAGNLWTFHTSLNRISITDVDNRDADGNPHITHLTFPAGMFSDRTYDLAFDGTSMSFVAVVAPKTFGGAGKVIRIDVSGVLEGQQPTFTEVPVTGTMVDGQMTAGMAKGAYGAVFFDGDGNLYYGLNNGDADMDQSTANSGGVFKINVDWDGGEAYAEFMSKAPATGSNDGAVDARSADAFIEVDADAAVLLRAPVLEVIEGGNDDLRGGAGDDTIFGNEGDDEINGGTGNDTLFGDEGHDTMSGGADHDRMEGGTGNDKMRGQDGDDILSGGEGTDYLHGGTGNDALSGDAGKDKLVGGTGADVIDGGAGNDQLWGGDWSADAAADVFVFQGGDGKDFVHDFETAHDVLDLTAYNTDLSSLRAVCSDEGWATIVNLSELDGGQAGDKLILKSVELEALNADCFLF